MSVFVPVMYMSTYDPSMLLEHGGIVEPKAGRTVVYVDNPDPHIRCAASTSSGETLSLAPFAGEQRRKVLGGIRSVGTPYWAVAELPKDLGPLRVSCPPVDNTMWIAAPDDNTWLYVFLCLIATMSIIMLVVGVVLRRRQRATQAQHPGAC